MTTVAASDYAMMKLAYEDEKQAYLVLIEELANTLLLAEGTIRLLEQHTVPGRADGTLGVIRAAIDKARNTTGEKVSS